MVKIRTLGSTYTKLDQQNTLDPDAGPESLGRGLVPKLAKETTDKISPEALPDSLLENPGRLMSHAISMIDKFIGKTKSLRRMNQEAHLERLYLSKELWELLLVEFKRLEISNEDISKLRDSWDWRCFPYAHVAVTQNLSTDKTNKALFKYKEEAKIKKNEETDDGKSGPIEKSSLEGNWRSTFCVLKGNKLDYPAIARKMMKHILEQELTIEGKVRETRRGGKNRPTGKGRLEVGGRNLAATTDDPRTPKPHPKKPISKETEKFYFSKNDVAKELFKFVGEMIDVKERIRPSLFGQTLYKHFNALKDETGPETSDRFNCHNQVRNFYAKLARSQRFKIAVRDGDPSQVLPQDKDQLMRILRGKKKNTDISRILRLGKLVVHAAEMPLDTADPKKTFKERMDFLATSAGQSELKRAEAFVRIWRNAVAMSAQTLNNLTGRSQDIQQDQPEGDMLGTVSHSRTVAGELDLNELDARLAIIFGNKNLSKTDKTSRTDIFLNGDEQAKKGIVFSLIRLAGEVRNRSNHFYTMSKVIELISGGILEETEENDITNLRLDHATSDAMKAFKTLLEHDRKMLVVATKEVMKALQAHLYLDNKQLSIVGSLLVTFEASKTVNLPARPRFHSILKRVSDLADNIETQLPEPLTGFAKLDISLGGKSKNSANKTSIGLLQKLYEVNFDSWLAEFISSEDEKFENILETMSQHRLTRSANTNKKEKRHYAVTTTTIEKLGLTTKTSLFDLLNNLAADAARHDGSNQTYNANKQVQKDVSNELEKFKQELFAYLFAKYLKDEELAWLCDLKNLNHREPEEIDNANFQPETDQFETKHWHKQFYTWLYFIPPEEVSLLRHQIRKTAVLRSKSEAMGDVYKFQLKTAPEPIDADDILTDIDALIGLFSRVHDAGFSGKETDSVINVSKHFFEPDSDGFKSFNPLLEDNDLNIPGVRRGLCTIARFNHIKLLEPIFEKHKLTSLQVEGMVELLNTDQQDDGTTSPHELKKQIIAIARHRIDDEKEKEIVPIIKEYRDSITQQVSYQFSLNAVRLNEYVRIHRLMMRIVGRLADYSLLWERDRLFMFYGLVHQQLNGEIEFNIIPPEDNKSSKGELTHNVKGTNRKSTMWTGDRGFEEPNRRAFENDAKRMLKGAGRENKAAIEEIIENWKHYRDYFEKPEYENYGEPIRQHPYDEMHREAVISDPNKPQTRNDMKDKPGTKKQRKKIRDEFAHFDILNAAADMNNRGYSKRANKDFSYFVNAARSLFGYDRKLKNAVSKSIIEVMENEGLSLKWNLKNDRLDKAEVQPLFAEHLSMVPKHLGLDAPFLLPRSSPRFTSMAQGMFSFRKKGHASRYRYDSKENDIQEISYISNNSGSD